ncbi:RNA polymerase sigma factor [Pseudoxanthomonas sp. 10H]|uniref:RNA polymerase sigma factor n=1 Tax=Pseudoxanthomonas sp. 10H TaxID=3242729 RepID=UPI003556EDBE
MDLATAMTEAPDQAFAVLLQRHRGIVHKVAGSYARGAEDRADLAQEIAAQLWRAWPSYDPSRSFSTWMYRIALNTAISFLRGQAEPQRGAVPLDDHLHELADERGFDPETHERLRVLQRFMATLGPLDRALLLLYLEERSGREMAEVLGIGESNVTTRIGRLRQRLREFAADHLRD